MIEVYNETEDNIYLEDIKNILNISLKKQDVKNAFVSVVIVSKEKIHEINKTYRNVDRVTDVISFAFEDNKMIESSDIRILGEIYLCIEKAKEQSVEYGHSEKREICYLSVHGLLHLLGYNHEVEDEKRIMRQKEEEILESYDAIR